MRSSFRNFHPFCNFCTIFIQCETRASFVKLHPFCNFCAVFIQCAMKGSFVNFHPFCNLPRKWGQVLLTHIPQFRQLQSPSGFHRVSKPRPGKTLVQNFKTQFLHVGDKIGLGLGFRELERISHTACKQPVEQSIASFLGIIFLS